MLRFLQRRYYDEIMENNPPKEDKDTFEVLCVGLSRCGTMSTIVALRQLLEGPIFHCGIDIFGTPKQEHVNY